MHELFFDDSKHEAMPEQFMEVCSKHDDVATWYRNTNEQVSGPSMGHANAIQFALDNIVYTSCLDDIVFLIDSDIFLMEKFLITHSLPSFWCFTLISSGKLYTSESLSAMDWWSVEAFINSVPCSLYSCQLKGKE